MEGLLEAFIALFVIMDPIGNLTLFINLTKGMPLKEIKRNIDRSVFVAGVLLFIFLFFGLQVFDLFGIDLDSFQIAGGIVLLIMGILYVFGASLKYVKSHGFDLSVPVGTPLLTGPGVITITIILVKERGILVTVIAAFLTLLAFFGTGITYFQPWYFLWLLPIVPLLPERWQIPTLFGATFLPLATYPLYMLP